MGLWMRVAHTPVIPAHTPVIPVHTHVIPATTHVIPAHAHVIPAKAGISRCALREPHINRTWYNIRNSDSDTGRTQ